MYSKESCASQAESWSSSLGPTHPPKSSMFLSLGRYSGGSRVVFGFPGWSESPSGVVFVVLFSGVPAIPGSKSKSRTLKSLMVLRDQGLFGASGQEIL